VKQVRLAQFMFEMLVLSSCSQRSA
jgi:hypothetical protein